MNHTHVTAPTRFVESDGIKFAYRRFGQESGIPLLFFQHFRGGMDHWNPAVTDGFAQDRPVVLFDNAGVAGTTGDTPNTIEAMAGKARPTLVTLMARKPPRPVCPSTRPMGRASTRAISRSSG